MAFHQFDINELYSNADGSIQFIELKVGNFNSENLWDGHTITVTQGAAIHSYTFLADLPGNTANKSVLIATQGFADLGIVVPDYIVPSGFLFVNGATVNFAGVDSVSYTALPTDGTLSINRSGTGTIIVNTGTNSPTNFVGATGRVATPVNQPPVLNAALPDQSATEDSAFSFTVPADAFVDAGDALSYSATKADGSALPAWLAFSPTTRAFSGTPANANVGSVDIKVTAADGSAAAVSDIFRITVANTNDAPTVASAVADQAGAKDSAFSFVVPVNAFADVDAGDTLSYSATKADGSALPAWLAFDASTRTFSGTPGASDSGTINVKVTAADAGNASDTDVFALTITPVTVGVQVYAWKSHKLLSGVDVGLDGGTASTTDSSGALSFAGVTGTSISLTGARAVPGGEASDTGNAVNLQDAIAILKMIVGLDVNGAGNAISPYQALAADYDANAKVELTDAIGVLKHVVGLAAPQPSWLFVYEADPAMPGKAATNGGLSPGTITAAMDLIVVGHVGLVGVLRGDVDGNYSGPAGAIDLDETEISYFADLVANHAELSPAQFGIYS